MKMTLSCNTRVDNSGIELLGDGQPQSAPVQEGLGLEVNPKTWADFVTNSGHKVADLPKPTLRVTVWVCEITPSLQQKRFLVPLFSVLPCSVTSNNFGKIRLNSGADASVVPHPFSGKNASHSPSEDGGSPKVVFLVLFSNSDS
ncbi:hypothetical protein U1Q18_025680 [Sarracenia purpurea var. burkii]